MNVEKIIKKVGRFEIEGYRNIKCMRCGQNMPWFVGDIRYPVCSDCATMKVSKAGNTNPSVPPEIRRYSG